MAELSAWGNFYLIVGSATGALIGLQFIVLTLIAQKPPDGASEASAAFSTPTIVYFGTSFLLSAVMVAHWQSLIPPSIILGSAALAGILYAVIILRRIRAQNYYMPLLTDWFFYFILPLLSYLLLLISAFASFHNEDIALYGAALSSLLFLLIGIHNAWDTVTYHLFLKKEKE